VEVESGTYRFHEDTTIVPQPKLPAGKAWSAQILDDTTEFVADIVSVFRYNPLHDYESIFWMVVWALFGKLPEDFKSQIKTIVSNPQISVADPEGPWDWTALQEFLPTIFPSTTTHQRFEFINQDHSRLLMTLCAPKFECVINHLALYRKELRQAFGLAEKNLRTTGNIDPDAWNDAFANRIWNRIHTMAHLVSQAYPGGVKMIDFPAAEAVKPTDSERVVKKARTQRE
jgi:hypothetical protein